jgi:hypothetical protein
VQQEAALIGPATSEMVQRMLADPVLDRLPSAGRVVRLARHQEIGNSRLEAACRRALAFEELSYRAVKRILAEGLETELPQAVANTPVTASRFVRPAGELLGHLFEKVGTLWN